MNQIDLKGRNAIVTGAAQGIGREIAKRLLQSGAQISLWDMDEELLEKTADSLAEMGHMQKVTVDVTDLEAVVDATALANKHFGHLDILVANAGIAGPSMKLWQYPPREWQKVIDVDLTGVFNCYHAIVPHMIERNYGRIVSTSSIAGKEGNPNAGPYSAAKAGVIALTKSLGKELADYNIAVNCITPAAVETRIFEQISKEHIEYMLAKIPRRRFLLVEEVASMVAWLVSEENSFSTGAVFDLSGGRATY
jgi:3-oxoacyl-[acyl-carrier protein] reductase